VLIFGILFLFFSFFFFFFLSFFVCVPSLPTNAESGAAYPLVALPFFVYESRA
jgi:hypothetical protein